MGVSWKADDIARDPMVEVLNAVSREFLDIGVVLNLSGVLHVDDFL